jgi:hypothetical protein
MCSKNNQGPITCKEAWAMLREKWHDKPIHERESLDSPASLIWAAPMVARSVLLSCRQWPPNARKRAWIATPPPVARGRSKRKQEAFHRAVVEVLVEEVPPMVRHIVWGDQS